MTRINTNIEDLIDKGLSTEQAKESFNTVVTTVLSREYQLKLTKMFNFALEKDCSLFTKIRVEQTISTMDMCNDYLSQWCQKYVDNRENRALKRPLKNYGEHDSALIERVAANTGMPINTLNDYLVGHFVFMSAENMNGAILEEYLAEVLEPSGWIWCAGSTFKAIDFCYLHTDNIILLQVKNKYNTENSSSSAIRIGTEIKKWNRLKRPRAATGMNIPLPNWQRLIELIDASKSIAELLTEEKYLEYIRQNSTKDLDVLE